VAVPAEAQRLRDAGLGILNSLHPLRLAQDLLCFRLIEGTYTYLAIGSEPEYKLLGDRWKTYHPLARWGGDFTKPDWDHYSSRGRGAPSGTSSRRRTVGPHRPADNRCRDT